MKVLEGKRFDGEKVNPPNGNDDLVGRVEQHITSKKTKSQNTPQQIVNGHQWAGAATLSSLIFGYAMREAIVNDEPLGYIIGAAAGVVAVLSYGVWGTYRDEKPSEPVYEQRLKETKEQESVIQVKNQSQKYLHNMAYVFGS